jgi:cytochrome b561
MKSVMGCIGSVLKAQDSPKEEKGKWMWRHKSMGLLAAAIIAPRVAYRLLNRKAYDVEKIAGAGGVEHKISQLTHYALYSFMTIMPATGIAMGYYGGAFGWNVSHFLRNQCRISLTIFI